MLNTFSFYKIYEKLFMNNFSEILINYIVNNEIKFKKKNLLSLMLELTKEPFQEN